MIEDDLRQTLAAAEGLRGEPRPTLSTFRGDGLQPGVDLDDSAALRAVMDDER